MVVTVSRTPDEHRATVTIDRPDVRNAMSSSVIADIGAAVDDLAEDDAIRAIVITGEGSAFSSGADVNEFVDIADDPEAVIAYLQSFGRLFEHLEACPCPIVAKVNGPAHGGGYELAMACDVRVASTNAELCPAEINVGLVPPFERLTNQLSEGMARELCFTGRALTAEEAVEAGAFNHVVKLDDLDERTDDLVDEIVATSPNAVAQTKQAMIHYHRNAIADSGSYRIELDRQCVRHPDFEESIAAFQEDRDPEYGR